MHSGSLNIREIVVLCNTITFDKIVLTTHMFDLCIHDTGWHQCIACIKSSQMFWAAEI